MKKKSISLSLETLVIIIILLIALVVLVLFFTGNFSKLGGQVQQVGNSTSKPSSEIAKNISELNG